MTRSQVDRMVRTLFVVALLPAACYSAGPGADRVIVRNDAGTSVIVMAFDLETASRVDPSPELVVDQHTDRLIEPGGERALRPEEIDGGLGDEDDLVLFLYEVIGTRAMFRGSLVVPRATLERDGYQVRIGPGAFA